MRHRGNACSFHCRVRGGFAWSAALAWPVGPLAQSSVAATNWPALFWAANFWAKGAYCASMCAGSVKHLQFAISQINALITALTKLPVAVVVIFTSE